MDVTEQETDYEKEFVFSYLFGCSIITTFMQNPEFCEMLERMGLDPEHWRLPSEHLSSPPTSPREFDRGA